MPFAIWILKGFIEDLPREIEEIFAWNDFAYAVIFSGSKVPPLPVVIAQFAGGHEILWGQISAAAILAIAPALLIAIFLQKYLTRGLTMGAVK